MTGLFIGARGLGGTLFSSGLDALAREAAAMGWAAKVYNHGDGADAAAEWKNWPGPIVVAWHSAGEAFGKIFAKEIGRRIEAAIAVDSWFPGQIVEANYARVISVISERDRRFHVQGAQVVEKRMIADTWHVTVDDSDELRALLLREIALLTKEPTVDPHYPAELAAMKQAAAAALDPSRETAAGTAFNRAFFATIRPLFGRLNQPAVDSLRLGLHLFEAYIRPKGFAGTRGDELFGFVAGNALNEVGPAMQPIRETGKSTDAAAIAALDAWWASGKAAAAGVKAPYWRPANAAGVAYFGRGLFQTTHEGNYRKAGALWEKWFGFALDFVASPSLMLDPVVSWLAAFIGVAEGQYTGKRLDDFRQADGSIDWPASRAMVNGDRFLVRRDLDHDGAKENQGEEIAGAIRVFLTALEQGRKSAGAAAGELQTVPATPEPSAPLPAPVEPSTPAPVPNPEVLTLDTLRQAASGDLRAAMRRAADLIKLATLVLDEREQTPSTVSKETAGEAPADEGENPMKGVFKLLGGIIGLAMGKAVAAGVLPPELATAAEPVLQGIITPQTIFELLFTGLGVYFAPRNVYPDSLKK